MVALVALAVAASPTLARAFPERSDEATVAQRSEHAPAGPAPTPLTRPTSQAARKLADGTTLAAWSMDKDVKVFNLVLARKRQTVADGKVADGLSVNGSIPAPTIRVQDGDKLRIVVKNDLMDDGTSIHWHGMDLPNPQDGVPGITQPVIPPGGQRVYEWAAISTGTHWYHSHMSGDQEGRGVFGALIVEPLAGDVASDRDYTLIFGDGVLGFTINGKSFPATSRLPARVGERVRLRLIGAGPDLIHSIHLHSGYFTVVAQDGRPLPAPYEADTVVLGVGQTFDLLFVPTRVGAWMLHCHIFAHSETKNGMTGMVTLIDVADPAELTAPQVPA